MQRSDLPTRLARAKDLLKNVRHASVATVNADGTPHNTPLYLVFDQTIKHLYFGSSPQSLHAKNIARSRELFVVLYETNAGGGLYIKAANGHELSGAELRQGLVTFNAALVAHNRAALSETDYSGKSPQRLYGADVITLWVNVNEKDESGRILRDYRHEISAHDLLG